MATAAAAENTNSKSPPAKSEQSQSEQNASATGMWQSSKLIGLNVYNTANEKIGDIKEIMLDKQGKADLVVIGVGGFLGMGERDVAVKFSEMKWSNEPVRANTANTRQGTTTGSAASNSSAKQKQNYPDHAVFNADKNQLKKMPQFNYNK
jgi:sporulation protein YlmC with PRC-barrel domain